MTRSTLPSPSSIEEEFADAPLGDVRRAKRLVRIAAAVANCPGASFPKACIEEAALEGAYRFFSNEAVSFEEILQPHYRCSRERALQASKPVLVVHDTTEVEIPGEGVRVGLGPLRKKKNGGPRGFFAHVALAVIQDELRVPLGVVGASTFARDTKRKGKRSHRQLREDPTRESIRWSALVDDVRKNLGDEAECIHVMDREGDNYSLFSKLIGDQERFIIRLTHDRALPESIEGTKGHLRVSDALKATPVVLERTVSLSPRKMKVAFRSRDIHPARDARVARLEIRASVVELLRPFSAGTGPPPTLKLNIVQVTEVDPPNGETPVVWTLATNEAIDSKIAVAAIVDGYRCRWTIEEFFRALKSGCSVEKRQLESLHALRNALAVMLPIAWRMLLLRSLARAESTEPATVALTEPQLRVLNARLQRNWKAIPTVTQAFEAIARLGGHIRNNGFPGWQVLARGFLELLTLATGWDAALKRSDQW